ncbi:polyhydroxyalkanoate synthesis repressor PhaR [Pelomonas sp. SE-A7]|uniref:polyhydroxyalkanoate synthesis repressor PhaR n=1 Tax=Pelomonas sp. SE-A7 TaxID=3054953 RepID=UPI00259D30B8|nr:polyhydroxyalkanoate synthesis repressor PhaR [Pelomonas sp. SE-A7]MDM4765768.1 polyhydroxyalkanoate synthesis repressor PhaR [Pelomonas sp. SE-A7]
MATARRGKTTADKAAAGEAAAPELRILKKYPNRRLYDTQTSSYITLADVKKMVLDGQSFEVRDAKTGEDLTRSILLQIILEEETGGMPMFTTQSLEQIIRFYGHAMQGVMGEYLERNMQVFSDAQQRFAEQSKGLAFSPEQWTQFMGTQAPMMQTLMGGYMEQGKSLLEQMQKAFPGMPGMPGFPAKK